MFYGFYLIVGTPLKLYSCHFYCYTNFDFCYFLLQLNTFFYSLIFKDYYNHIYILKSYEVNFFIHFCEFNPLFYLNCIYWIFTFVFLYYFYSIYIFSLECTPNTSIFFFCFKCLVFTLACYFSANLWNNYDLLILLDYLYFFL